MIYDNIKRLCSEEGISINALEDKLVIGNGVIGSWRNQNPSLMNMIKVADYFNISLDELVSRDEIKRSANEA